MPANDDVGRFISDIGENYPRASARVAGNGNAVVSLSYGSVAEDVIGVAYYQGLYLSSIHRVGDSVELEFAPSGAPNPMERPAAMVKDLSRQATKNFYRFWEDYARHYFDERGNEVTE